MGDQLFIGELASIEAKKDNIDKQGLSNQGGHLTGENIRAYIFEQWQKNYYPNAVYKLLHQLGCSWITSRSKHPKQFQTAQY